MTAENAPRAPHVVVIGAGFGGLTATRALARAAVKVTLIDRRNHHLFQPLLYQVATAGLSPADIAAPIRAVLRNQRNAEILLAEVTGVDLQRRVVQMQGREIDFDYLIIATGSTHSYFGKDAWEEFAPGLKSVEDATRIRRRILLAFEAAEMEPDPEKQRALLRFVIVGGGPTGCELAGSIAELSHVALASDFRHIDPKSSEILLIEAGPRILAAFPEDLSAAAANELRGLGVQIVTGARVMEIDAAGVRVGEKRIPASTVIWAAGVTASPAGKWLGAPTDRAGRVLVDPDLRVPGTDRVFVIGDTSSLSMNGKPLPGLAPVAMQQGRYVARWIRDRIQEAGGARSKDAKAPLPFQYRDKGNLATIGRKFAVLDWAGFHASGFVAWVLWLLVHIYYLIGFRNRVLVLMQWTWAYLTFQRGARLITAESRDSLAAIAPGVGPGTPGTAVHLPASQSH